MSAQLKQGFAHASKPDRLNPIPAPWSRLLRSLGARHIHVDCSVVMQSSTCLLHANLHVQPQQLVPNGPLQRLSTPSLHLRHCPKNHVRQGSLLGHAQKRCTVLTAAAGLDEGLSTSSSLLGSSTQPHQKEGSPEPPGSVEGVELASEADMDYSNLRDALQQGDFQLADDLTRAALITLAGPDAEKRTWVYFTEVKFIANTDLQTIDNLWRAASKNRQGFSIQKEMWMQNSKQWTKFFKQIDWTVGEFNNYRKWPQDFTYDMSAKKGHLPLTNCLRGTQLFKAILEHPAFERQGSNGSNGSTPDWLK